MGVMPHKVDVSPVRGVRSRCYVVLASGFEHSALALYSCSRFFRKSTSTYGDRRILELAATLDVLHDAKAIDDLRCGDIEDQSWDEMRAELGIAPDRPHHPVQG